MKCLFLFLLFHLTTISYSTCIIIYCIDDTTYFIAADCRKQIDLLHGGFIEDFSCKIHKYGNNYISFDGLVKAQPYIEDIYAAFESVYNNNKDTNSTIDKFNIFLKNKLTKLIKQIRKDCTTINKIVHKDGTLTQLINTRIIKGKIIISTYNFKISPTKKDEVIVVKENILFKPPKKTFKCFGFSDEAFSKMEFYGKNKKISSQITLDEILIAAINEQSSKTPKEVGGPVTIIEITPHTYHWINNPLNCK